MKPDNELSELALSTVQEIIGRIQKPEQAGDQMLLVLEEFYSRLSMIKVDCQNELTPKASGLIAIAQAALDSAAIEISTHGI